MNTLKKIISCLNTPLGAVLFGILFWYGLSFALQELRNRQFDKLMLPHEENVRKEKENVATMETIKRQFAIRQVRYLPTQTPFEEKVVAEVENNSAYVLTKVEFAAAFKSEAGELLDVEEHMYYDMAPLLPGDKKYIVIYRNKRNEETPPSAASADLTLESFTFFKPNEPPK